MQQKCNKNPAKILKNCGPAILAFDTNPAQVSREDCRRTRPGPPPRQLAAAAKLDAVRPDAARDLLSAMDNNPALERVMGELQGRECTTQPVAVLREEQPQEDRSMNDLPEHDEDGGGAARAFEDMRAEMSVLRRAVEALPAAWTDNQPPDYGPDLVRLNKRLASVATGLAWPRSRSTRPSG